MDIINKTPSAEYKEYTITEKQRMKLIVMAQTCGETTSSGMVYMWESVTNQMRLTPRHVSENFENLSIRVGSPIINEI